MSDTEQPKAGSVADRFIGPRKIEMVSVREGVLTPGGAEVVDVVYDGGFREVMPKVSFENLVTPQPTDYTKLSERRIMAVLKELVKVCAEHDLRGGEIESLKNSLANNLFHAINRVTHFLWTGDDASFVPGFNSVMDRSLLEADLILRKIPKADDAKENAGTGQAEQA